MEMDCVGYHRVINHPAHLLRIMVFWGVYIGDFAIMDKKMEATIGFRV